MSILGISADSIFLAVLVLLMVVGGVVTVAFNVYRPQTIVGPERLSDNRYFLQVAIAAVMAFFAMTLAAALYAVWKQRGTPAPVDGATPDIVDSAFLFSIPPLASLATLIFADLIIGGTPLLRRLGLTFSAEAFFSGIAKGILAAVVIVPPTYVVSILTEMVYRHVQFQHPGEHQLLTYLGQTPVHPFARIVLMFSAMLIAPLAEEFLFRGHLQTLIRRMLVLISIPRRMPPAVSLPIGPLGFPLDAPGQAADIPIAAIAPPVLTRPAVWQTWMAVFVTSCMFAAMHDRWTWPPIFFLSLGLGYCYERTGNLWTNVTVHCIFNSISTIIYLYSTHP